jgi:hypothetical protein
VQRGRRLVNRWMHAYDLLYAPIGHPRGSLEDYVEKLDTLDAAEAAITTAVSNLGKAAQSLGGSGWKKSDVPGRVSGEGAVKYIPPIETPLDIAAWASLDEIKKLAEAYRSALADAEAAYKALSPSAQRNVRAPGKPPLS